jgi:hypothetical protein
MKRATAVASGLIIALAIAPLFWPGISPARAQSGCKSFHAIAQASLPTSIQLAVTDTWGGPHYSAWPVPEPVQALNTLGLEYPNGISRDGLSLYFHRINPGTNEDLYVAHRPDPEADWGVPVRLPDGVNTSFNDRVAVLSADGHWLYFASDRPDGLGGFDLYVSWRTHVYDDGDWQAPVNLLAVNSPGFDAGPALFEDQGSGTTHLYFTSAPSPGGTQAVADIYMSALGPGGFEPPSPVTELNSPGNDNRPYLRRDGREIFFASSRSGALTVWTSARPSTTQPWSPPVIAIDPSVIGEPGVTFATTPVLSWDATTLFIGVYRPGIDVGDIFVSHREKVRGVN